MSTAELQAIVEKLAISQAETDRQMKETDRQMKETDRQMKETDRKMKETDRQMKETDRQMKETDRQMKETDRKMQETDRQMKETDRQVKSMSKTIESLAGSIGREWGNLVESLTKTSCLEQMQALGIEVTQTAESTQSERPGFEQEWDVLLINGGELVAIEVKSRLRDGQLERMEEKLKVFKNAFPQYKDYKVYGAVAALKFNSHLNKIAEKKGFFVFEPSGEIMKITNHKNFKPTAY